MSTSATAAPSAANACAAARPIPEPAPVTSATLFSKDEFIDRFLLRLMCLPARSLALGPLLFSSLRVSAVAHFPNGLVVHTLMCAPAERTSRTRQSACKIRQVELERVTGVDETQNTSKLFSQEMTWHVQIEFGERLRFPGSNSRES